MTPNTLSICFATMNRPLNAEFTLDVLHTSHLDISTWHDQAFNRALDVQVWFNDHPSNLGVVGAYQKLYEKVQSDILLFLHDDVICREQDWDLRLMAEFIDDPSTAVVGFGGALWHGLPDLYKVPYQLQQLQRGSYRSNVDDAEVHGERFTGSGRLLFLPRGDLKQVAPKSQCVLVLQAQRSKHRVNRRSGQGVPELYDNLPGHP